MPSKLISRLRKEGKTEEALAHIQVYMADHADDFWFKRACGWVYYDLLKTSMEEKRIDVFISYLIKISDLSLTDKSEMLFDSVAWQTGKLLMSAESIANHDLDLVFQNIRYYNFTKPGDAYSFLLKSFKKHGEHWPYFPDFMVWWKVGNLHDGDFEIFKTPGGKKIPSLAESVCITLSKNLLTNPIDKNKIKAHIGFVADLSEHRKEMQYPPYYYAKLLLALGDKENFIKAFLPFLRKKQKDFWVWDLLSEGLKDEKEAYRACLCKSLLCGAPDKFTINVREKMALEMIRMQKFGEARYELETIIQTRKNEGWPITEKHLKYQNHPWWKSGESVKSNMGFYNKYASMAESLLYQDIPEELLVVEHVNKAKKVLYFVVSKTKAGCIYYGNFSVSPNRGDVFSVRFDTTQSPTKSNFYQVISLVLSEKRMLEEVTKSISGNIKIKPGNSFGFVQDVFVSDQLVRENQLEHGQYIEGVAVIKYNKMKKAWGWSAINLSKTISNE